MKKLTATEERRANDRRRRIRWLADPENRRRDREQARERARRRRLIKKLEEMLGTSASSG